MGYQVPELPEHLLSVVQQQAQQLLTDTSQKPENIQSNIQKNLDFILNNKSNNNELTVLNDSLQSLVEQMKIQNELQTSQSQNENNPNIWFIDIVITDFYGVNENTAYANGLSYLVKKMQG